MINMMGGDWVQKPSMLRILRCVPTSFISSISLINCRLSSSIAFSEKEKEILQKKASNFWPFREDALTIIITIVFNQETLSPG